MIYAEAYIATVVPTAKVLCLDTVKEYLKIDVTDSSEDLLLQSMMTSIEAYFELYTNIPLLNTTFETYRHSWFNWTELRKGKVSSVTSVKYYDEAAVLQTVGTSLYYLVPQAGYGAIEMARTFSPPVLGDRRPPIVITFVAGFGATKDSVPKLIQNALLSHLANWYENRGDCDDCSMAMSAVAKTVYNQYKIRSLVGGVSC